MLQQTVSKICAHNQSKDIMIQTTTIQFLKKLSKNNNKPWFEDNKPMYLEAKVNFEQLVSEVLTGFGQIDSDIAPLEVKKCIFRQHRDVRFSKDKTPYKTNFGASFDKGGKLSGLAGYYLHLEPNNKSMIGGGLWMPDAVALKKVRQEIDYNWDEFHGLLNKPSFKKVYGNLDMESYTLSREPKGYEKDNPAIVYLKLKSFVAINKLTDEEVLSKTLSKQIVKAFAELMPIIKFINRSLEQ